MVIFIWCDSLSHYSIIAGGTLTAGYGLNTLFCEIVMDTIDSMESITFIISVSLALYTFFYIKKYCLHYSL